MLIEMAGSYKALQIEEGRGDC